MHILPQKKQAGRKGPPADMRWLRPIYRDHVVDQIENLTGISPLVIIPGHELDKIIREHNTRLGIENRSAGIAQEVGGDNGLSLIHI